jgi:hypothetical protein
LETAGRHTLNLEDQQEGDQEHQSNDLEKDDTWMSAEEEEEDL